MALARQRGLAIVSADSRQVYRGFDIGTAKPSAAEQALVPHYGIDVADPRERYSAHQWATRARDWCREATAHGTPPLVVGGTGLYIRALVHPLDALPTVPPVARAALEPWLAARSRDELQRWCQRLDPARAHLGRTQLLRAIETALLTGQRLSESLGQNAAAPVPVRYLVVDPGPVLASRIASRVQAMCEAGFADEVRNLINTVPADAPAWNASGYGAMRGAVEGRMALTAALERIVIETRQYAKRQRTWFRHQLPSAEVTWLNPLDDGALDAAIDWWDADAAS